MIAWSGSSSVITRLLFYDCMGKWWQSHDHANDII